MRSAGELRALRFRPSSPWAIVAHPLWNAQNPHGRLASAIKDMDGEAFVVIDSFNLARRPVTIRGALLGL